MKSTIAFVPLLGLVLGTSIAQTPVPTRVKTSVDGLTSGFPEPVDLKLGIDASPGLGTRVLLTGGLPADLAILVVGNRPIEFKMEQGTILLVEPLAAVPGEFDKEGVFALPVELTSTALIAQIWYSQGLRYSPPPMGETFQMSERLGVSIAAGNAQPPLYYAGPPLTSLLLTKRVQDLAATHEVLSSVLAPTGGYLLSTRAVQHANGVTTVWLGLEAPNPEEIVRPEPEIVRTLSALGIEAQARIDVLIEQRTRGTAGLPVFLLAAAIERDF